jgi:enterochelin esterase family protein
MKNKLVFTLFLLLLAGCHPSASVPASLPSPSPTVVRCAKAGEIVSIEMDSPTRGYGYRINLYLPPCYHDQTIAYPVLYLIPGRGSGPAAWFNAGADPAADRLIRDGSLPPFLIVATENTDSDPQGEVIFKDVIPYIEEHYRVLADRRHRAVAGGSLGGIAAYRLAFQHPEAFSSVGIFGSGVIAGEEAALQGWLAALTDATPLKVFLACGENDPLMFERARVTALLLAGSEIPFVFVPLKGGHDYPSWVGGLDQYFAWLTQDW